MLSATMENSDRSKAAESPTESTSLDAPPSPRRGSALLDLLLTTDRKQRSYIIRFAMGSANALAALAALEIAVYIGICGNAMGVRCLTLAGILLELMFYVVLRTGLNKRFPDPSLNEYEIDASIACIAVGYWLAPRWAGAFPLVMLVVMLMFGMFATTPKQIGRCCLWALFTMSISFALVARTDGTDFSVTQQYFHAALVVAVLPTVYMLASQLALIRARLRKRKEDLEQALQRIEALSTIDILTGLLNRREMHNVLDRQEKLVLRGEPGFCICMIDIDFFKQVNDVHGHNLGDEVLRVFSATVQSALREIDIISRWGGEEFLVMMMEPDITRAKMTVERMRAAMNNVTIPTSQGPLKVTFSAGLARFRSGEPMDQVIDRADRALYRAKSQGRDCTVLDQVETLPSGSRLSVSAQ